MIKQETEDALKNFVSHCPRGSDDALVPKFYNKVMSSAVTANNNVAFIVVAHFVHSLPYFLNALAMIGPIVALIPKSSRTVVKVNDLLSEIYSEIIPANIDKHTLKEDDVASTFIDNIINQQRDKDYKFIIIDHGGYFAPQIMKVLYSKHEKILGIVEHTLNGELKYTDYLKSQDELPSMPIFSIAQSSLKEKEDYFVGKSIATSIDSLIFSGVGVNQLAARLKKVLVLGYGHIGESVAYNLENIIKKDNLYICDTSLTALNKASERFGKDHTTNAKQRFLYDSDLIIVATSTISLSKTDFNSLKEYAVVVCVTSSDDLFAGNALDNYTKSEQDKEATLSTYQHNIIDKTIYLASNGCTINFLLGSTPHPIIHAILALVCMTAQKLVDTNNKGEGSSAAINLNKGLQGKQYKTAIMPSSHEDELKIDRVYEEVYGKYDAPDYSAYYNKQKKHDQQMPHATNIVKYDNSDEVHGLIASDKHVKNFSRFHQQASSSSLVDFIVRRIDRLNPFALSRLPEGESQLVFHHNIPLQTKRLFGRDEHLRNLLRTIEEADRENHLLFKCIVGLPGVGKTSLALQLANQMKSRYPCLVWIDFADKHSLDHLYQRLLHMHTNALAPTSITLIEKISYIYNALSYFEKPVIFIDNVPSYDEAKELMPKEALVTHNQLTIIAISNNVSQWYYHSKIEISGLTFAETKKLVESYYPACSEALLKLIYDQTGGNPCILRAILETTKNYFSSSSPTEGEIEKFIDGVNWLELLKSQEPESGVLGKIYAIQGFKEEKIYLYTLINVLAYFYSDEISNDVIETFCLIAGYQSKQAEIADFIAECPFFSRKDKTSFMMHKIYQRLVRSYLNEQATGAILSKTEMLIISLQILDKMFDFSEHKVKTYETSRKNIVHVVSVLDKALLHDENKHVYHVNYTPLLVKMLTKAGSFHMRITVNHAKAGIYLLKAAELVDSDNQKLVSPAQKAETYRMVGLAYRNRMQRSSFQKSIYYLTLAKGFNNIAEYFINIKQANILIDIASIYRLQGETDKSLRLLQEEVEACFGIFDALVKAVTPLANSVYLRMLANVAGCYYIKSEYHDCLNIINGIIPALNDNDNVYVLLKIVSVYIRTMCYIKVKELAKYQASLNELTLVYKKHYSLQSFRRLLTSYYPYGYQWVEDFNLYSLHDVIAISKQIQEIFSDDSILFAEYTFYLGQLQYKNSDLYAALNSYAASKAILQKLGANDLIKINLQQVEKLIAFCVEVEIENFLADKGISQQYLEIVEESNDLNGDLQSEQKVFLYKASRYLNYYDDLYVDLKVKFNNLQSMHQHSLCWNPFYIVENNLIENLAYILLNNEQFSWDINERNKQGKTCLHIAAEKGLDDVCALLISFNANLYIKDSDQKTAFGSFPLTPARHASVALNLHKEDLLRLKQKTLAIIENYELGKININDLADESKQSLALRAGLVSLGNLYQGKNQVKQLAEMLDSSCYEIINISLDWNIHNVAESNQLTKMQYILNLNNVDINKLDDISGNTCLDRAYDCGHFDMCVLLLKNGAKRTAITREADVSAMQNMSKVQDKNLYSEIDCTRSLGQSNWVLSMVKQVELECDENIFLVLEGLIENKKKVWFMQKVVESGPQYFSEEKIKLTDYQDDVNEQFLLRYLIKKMGAKDDSRINFSSWTIERGLAEHLLQKVKLESEITAQSLMPNGINSLSTYEKVLNKQNKHRDSFLWAKQQINELNNPDINISSEDVQGWLVSASCRQLTNTDSNKANPSWYKQPLKVAAVSLAAGLFGYLLISNPNEVLKACFRSKRPSSSG